ncbi:MAG: hypothetical protein LiPW41_397 [Parcubacteria group bacterium LiPW_41]|nr:MAG: hypothetical protein LiPW41_397 [Parcubacteria group bacterium LiPW_41]
MKAPKIIAFLILLLIAPTAFGQVAITGDVCGTPFGTTPEKWSTWGLYTRFGISEQITLVGSWRSSRSREVSVSHPEKSPSEAGFLGVSYSTRFFEIAPLVGLQRRENPRNKDLGWIVGVEGFLGYVTKDNYYLQKQVFIYYRIEKGQFDTDPYIDVRGLFPLLDLVAVGGRFESDMGFGAHGEFKISIAEKETYKAIYLYGTYYMQEKIAVIGARITVN